jgi:lipoic acid synthetase
MIGRLPHWFKQEIPDPRIMSRMKSIMDGLNLHTICESAICPNIGACFARNTATFLILGDTCTRRCTFCAVKKGTPSPVDDAEPQHVLKAVQNLGLRYVVITSVTRDDLSDGGASHFAETIETLKQEAYGVIIEVLVPDFGGSIDALDRLITAAPHLISHNVETVPSLYSRVRPGADYAHSLRFLSDIKRRQPKVFTKSGLMLGLGETKEEVLQVMFDLHEAGCDLITIGQYLQPSPSHYPVVTFCSPQEFLDYEGIGRKIGFIEVVSGPLVRSSYRAAEIFAKCESVTQ